MQQPAAPVSTYTVSRAEWTPEIEAIGTVSAIQGVELPSKLPDRQGYSIQGQPDSRTGRAAAATRRRDRESRHRCRSGARCIDGSDFGACPHAHTRVSAPFRCRRGRNRHRWPRRPRLPICRPLWIRNCLRRLSRARSVFPHPAREYLPGTVVVSLQDLTRCVWTSHSRAGPEPDQDRSADQTWAYG